MTLQVGDAARRVRPAFLSWRAGLILLVIGLSSLAATVKLSSFPALWWDEGWTLDVARNWVVHGFYGQVNDGQYLSPGLAASFPVVAPVALSFRLLGVGVWQGRLPGVLFTFASLGLIFYLAKRLYSSTIAWGTLGMLLLMTGSAQLQPILVGRQVLGEMPAVFYLLAGYTLLLLALDRKAWLIVPAAVVLGIAVEAKAQVLPFFVFSLLLAAGFALWKGWRKPAALLPAGLVGSLVCYGLFPRLIAWVLAGHTLPGEVLSGMYGVTAMVLSWSVRQDVLVAVLTIGLPTLAGLIYAAWRIARSLRREAAQPGVEVLRLALFGLAGSWFAWFVLLAQGWGRYLFPSVFLSAPFSAALFYELTRHFSLPATVLEASALFLKRRVDRASLGALLAVVMVAITVPFNLFTFYLTAVSPAGDSAAHVAEYLNTQTPPGAKIETYESELFFFLDRPYHYPPDQLHVTLIRRTTLDPSQPVDYDPLASNPDYLVTGVRNDIWALYNPLLAQGGFKLVYSQPPYRVYARLRP